MTPYEIDAFFRDARPEWEMIPLTDLTSSALTALEIASEDGRLSHENKRDIVQSVLDHHQQNTSHHGVFIHPALGKVKWVKYDDGLYVTTAD